MGLQEDFEKAAVESKQLTEKPSNDELLELYGLYKVANGEDFSAAEAPGAFALKAKYKYNSWKKYVEAGLSADDAKKQYIELVEKLKVTYKFDASKQPETVGDS